MATQEELDALTPEQREAAIAVIRDALGQIAEGLSDLTSDELDALEREIIEDVDAGIRRHAESLQRTAS